MTIAILYPRLVDHDESDVGVGGAQAYLLRLATLCRAQGWRPVILQLADTAFTRRLDGIELVGCAGLPPGRILADVGRFLAERAVAYLSGDDLVIVFGTDTIAPPDCSHVHIVIQHGICTDMPDDAEGSPWARGNGLAASAKHVLRQSRLNCLRRGWMAARRYGAPHWAINPAAIGVCVDYNFLNVYRAEQKRWPAARVHVIPNYAESVSSQERATRPTDGPPRVLFARRFHWYRGTRLMAVVAERLLRERSDVEFTFAGEGPDETWLKERFTGVERVSFIRYRYDEATRVLLSHDIAVVPSLGSEGTSLSALEAMAAGCCVVASCVGGLTNIIIDGYNGRLVLPAVDALSEALHEVIGDPNARQRMASKGLELAQNVFSLELWQERWAAVLRQAVEESLRRSSGVCHTRREDAG